VAIACRAVASPKAGVGRNFSITPKDSDPAGDIYRYACGGYGRLYTWQSPETDHNAAAATAPQSSEPHLFCNAAQNFPK
jgi:hypothetical protein